MTFPEKNPTPHDVYRIVTQACAEQGIAEGQGAAIAKRAETLFQQSFGSGAQDPERLR